MDDDLQSKSSSVLVAPDCKRWEGVTERSWIGSLASLKGSHGMW